MHILGLMSGTSLDGIDACLIEVTGVGDRLQVRFLGGRTLPFPPGLREAIMQQLDPATSRVDALAALNVALGEAFADAAIACCDALGFPLAALDAIGSHGQTLWHQPHGPHPASLQLGEPAVIAARTGVTTVGNFRAADVAAGGQGAPLVPYVDHVLFGGRGRAIALQNLGGIGNVTYLPGAPDPAGILAFDTGPGNMVIDGLAQALMGAPYDEDGRGAAAGRVNADWLAALLADPYLAAPPPKSTGREAYGAPRVAALLAEGRARGLSAQDMLATATAWTAATIADQYGRFLPQFPEAVYVSGGGARNATLMAQLAARLPCPVRPLAELGVDPDFKEALAFAVLAHQTLVGQPNVLARTTGARRAQVLGQISPGANFARVILKAQPPAEHTTEAVNPASRGLDTLPVLEAARVMHAQDYDAVRALAPALPAIAALVERVAACLRAGGRLFYVGAGTSGRLGVLDASECPPTFSVPPEWVQGVIAGGDRALREAVEGAEDDADAGAGDLAARGCGPLDVVVGVSANGGAPYVRGALAYARAQGAFTALLTCNPPPAATPFDLAVVLNVGPEVLSGSTRLKAGTATKLALNMVSTLAMVRLGKVHDNLMVDLRVSNHKLQARACRLVQRLTGLEPDAAAALLARADGRVKRAVVMHALGVEADEAARRLAESDGFLRPWLEKVAPPISP